MLVSEREHCPSGRYVHTSVHLPTSCCGRLVWFFENLLQAHGIGGAAGGHTEWVHINQVLCLHRAATHE
jgi:hypothetical protein